MSDVYNCCCNIPGLAPERIASYITNLLVFTDCPVFTNIKVYSAKDTGKREIGAGDTKVGRENGNNANANIGF